MFGRDEVVGYIHELFSVDPDYPWVEYPEYAVFRHPENNKWFGLLAKIPYSKLDGEKEGNVYVLNVKISKSEKNDLLIVESIYPAYHMNKDQWVSIALDGNVREILIKKLIDKSFISTLSIKDFEKMKIDIDKNQA